RHVTGNQDGMVKVWDADTGQRQLTLKGHPGTVHSVVYSADGKRIVSGSGRDPWKGGLFFGGEVKVWDARTGQELLTLGGQTGGVLSVAISPDGKHIVSGGADETAGGWDVHTGLGQRVLTGH